MLSFLVEEIEWQEGVEHDILAAFKIVPFDLSSYCSWSKEFFFLG
jgi:hypothetical protein